MDSSGAPQPYDIHQQSASSIRASLAENATAGLPLLARSADVDAFLSSQVVLPARKLSIERPTSGVRRPGRFMLTGREWLRLVMALCVTLLFTIILVASLVLATRIADLGFITATDPSGKTVVQRVVPNGLGYTLGVRPGDIVVSWGDWPNGPRWARVALNAGVGPIKEVSTHEVEKLHPLQRFTFVLLALIFIAVGGPVFVKARHRSAALAFYLFCIASAACLLMATISQLLIGWALAFMFICLVAWAATFAIFFLKFPVKVGRSRQQHNMIVGAIILGGLFIVALYFYIYFVAPGLYPVAQLNNMAYLALCTLVGLGSLVRAFFVQRTSLVRNQLTVLVLGTALAVGPSLLLGLAPRLLSLPSVDIQITVLSLVLMPLAFAYAITQHQLMGVRGLVRRGVVYVIMGFAVLMVFSLTALSISAVLPAGWFRGELGLVIIGIFVFLIALSYGYVQRRVEAFVDRFIYHDGYDYKHALLDLSAQIATEQDLSRLATDLVERTCRLMNLTCGVLLLAEQSEGKLRVSWTPEEARDVPHDDLQVIPYAKYGEGADWLIEGLQRELAGLGIHLVRGVAPTEVIYFTHRTHSSDRGDAAFTSGPLPDLPPLGQESAFEGTFQARGTPTTPTLDEGGERKSLRSFLGVPLWTRQRFVGMLCLGNKRTGESFSKDDLSLLGTLSTQAALAVYNAQLFEAQRQALLGTIEALAHSIEAKDGYTIRHCERMTERATALAQALRLPDDEVENIRMAAILHDIGKIGIPDSILNKPGRLTPEEYEVMKEHTVIGARIVQSVGALSGVVPIVRHHHERYDGSGYPDKLKGKDIPLGARIIGIVDTYGAMTEDRVYRPAPGHKKAVAELAMLAGQQFDPEIVPVFLRLLDVRPDLAELSQNLAPSTRLL